MRVNWKQRFRNRTWVLAFLLGLIAMGYQMLAVYKSAKQGVPPQELLTETAKMLVTWLVQIGVIVDPTTAGTSDSTRALTYGKFDYSEHAAMGEGSENDWGVEHESDNK